MDQTPMNITVILAAAGIGRRFEASDQNVLTGGPRSKLDQELRGKAVFIRSAELFVNQPGVGRVILAVQPDRLEEIRAIWGDKLGFLGIEIVAGGEKERWQTVQRALAHVDGSCTHVAVHDAARPLTPSSLIARVFEAAQTHSAVIPGVPIAGTLKRVVEESDGRSPRDQSAARVDDILGGQAVGTLADNCNNDVPRRVVETIDRTDVVEVQTPQIFELALLRRAYQQIDDNKIDTGTITDDAGLVEAMGGVVRVVAGDPVNIKITRAADIELAKAVLATREPAEAALQARRRLFADDDE